MPLRSLSARGLSAVGVLLACTPSPRPPEPGVQVASPRERRVESNAHRSDYVGSNACAGCHAEIHAAWSRSPMHRMTRDAATANVRAPFDGRIFELGGDAIAAEMQDGRRVMRLVSRERGERVYRITKVIGGRYREDFAGVDVTSLSGSLAASPVEEILPVSFVYSSESFRYKGYSVLVKERPGLRVGPAWSKQCIVCHNTLPHFSTVFDDLIGAGAPSYQGSVSDDLLPRSRRWAFAPTDSGELARALRDEIAFLGDTPDANASPIELLDQALRATRDRLDTQHLVELGVGCESCHGGAREHVDDPGVLPTFEARSRAFEVAPASGTPPSRAEWLNRACARCHTVLFTRYPYTWEGGERRQNPGGSSINSGEARDFLLGGCASRMSCASCHEPHAGSDPERLEALGTTKGNTVCTGCHAKLTSEAALRAHTHHSLDSAGSACVACHMPRKNMGLAYELTRYHRIGSPTDEERVLRDRPLECALCHPNAGVETVVRTMERWWGRRYDRASLRHLYGNDLSVNALDATLAWGKPHEQAVAIGVLGERGGASVAAKLAPHVSHEFPLVRFYAKHAIERAVGEPLPIDPNRPAPEIADAMKSWRTARTSAGRERDDARARRPAELR